MKIKNLVLFENLDSLGAEMASLASASSKISVYKRNIVFSKDLEVEIYSIKIEESSVITEKDKFYATQKRGKGKKYQIWEMYDTIKEYCKKYNINTKIEVR